MEKKRCARELPRLEHDSNLLGKEARYSEINENDHDCGLIGHGFGSGGLCSTQGGSDHQCWHDRLREIDRAAEFIVGRSASSNGGFGHIADLMLDGFGTSTTPVRETASLTFMPKTRIQNRYRRQPRLCADARR